MTDLIFEPVVIPGGQHDSAPPIDAPEYPCEICGKEAGPYKGRGRKPKRCEEHKRQTSGGSASKTKGTNSSLAASAADALCQWNGLVTVGLMVTGYHTTASAIAERESLFREQAYAALVTDPSLCRIILRAGTTSAKLSLLMAYGMLGVAVAPTAVLEYRAKQAANEKAKEAA